MLLHLLQQLLRVPTVVTLAVLADLVGVGRLGCGTTTTTPSTTALTVMVVRFVVLCGGSNGGGRCGRIGCCCILRGCKVGKEPQLLLQLVLLL